MDKVKNFFIRVGLWFKRHAPTKRRLIQLYATLLVNANIKGYVTGNIYTGDLKHLCSPGLNCYSCPGASLACPLGALQDSMAQSGERAAFYIVGILALFGIMLARTICGFLCPFGLVQDLLYKVKTPKLKKSRYTRVLSYFKYILLAVLVIAIPLIYHGIPAFCKYVCPAGTLGGAIGLLANESNSSFFSMLGYLFSWKFIVLVLVIVGSIFIYRIFCRFICPLGAIYGFFNKYALIGVKLDSDKCIDCGACIRTCKMDIAHVGDHECINCGECIPVCPTKAISWKGSQIFLKGMDIEPVTAPQTGVNLLKTSSVAVSEIVPAEENNASESEITASGDVGLQPEPEAPKPVKTAAEKIKTRNFRLQVSAWGLAVVVLISALVYLNFFDKKENYMVYGVGDRCPDIVLDTYNSNGAYDEDGNRIQTFSTMESRGTVTVINFWYTTCDPCVAELPYFEKVRAEFKDEIIMVAVHSSTSIPKEGKEGVQNFIDGNGWNDWGIIFAQDTEDVHCYESLGGNRAFPTTVIVDKSGYIAYFQAGPMEEDELRNKISELVNE